MVFEQNESSIIEIEECFHNSTGRNGSKAVFVPKASENFLY